MIISLRDPREVALLAVKASVACSFVQRAQSRSRRLKLGQVCIRREVSLPPGYVALSGGLTRPTFEHAPRFKLDPAIQIRSARTRHPTPVFRPTFPRQHCNTSATQARAMRAGAHGEILSRRQTEDHTAAKLRSESPTHFREITAEGAGLLSRIPLDHAIARPNGA